jgi:membrane associated rhomboid family serine protease
MTCYRHPDRETRVSCSECGRGICPDCMVFGPVGIKCPEHAGVATGPVAQAARRAQRTRLGRAGAPITLGLIGVNVLVYLLELAGGADLSARSGWIYEHGALVTSAIYSDGGIAGVAHGEWWRLLTAAFLHAGLIHLGMNMLTLWWVGRPLEEYLGSLRFLLLYVVGGLAGSAGALLLSPDAITVGASGAIFGIFGALFVIEQMRAPGQIGPAATIIILNLVITFSIPNISIGGHIGGLVGGALGALALARFGRGHVAYGRPGLVGIAALVAVGVASVVVSYWRVRGYA